MKIDGNFYLRTSESTADSSLGTKARYLIYPQMDADLGGGGRWGQALACRLFLSVRL